MYIPFLVMYNFPVISLCLNSFYGGVHADPTPISCSAEHGLIHVDPKNVTTFLFCMIFGCNTPQPIPRNTHYHPILFSNLSVNGTSHRSRHLFLSHVRPRIVSEKHQSDTNDGRSEKRRRTREASRKSAGDSEGEGRLVTKMEVDE